MSTPASVEDVIREPLANAEARESSALVVGAAAFVVGTVVALFAFWGRDLAISGRGSLGDFAAIGSAIAAAAGFVIGGGLRRRSRRRRDAAVLAADDGARLHWFDIAVIAIAHAILALLGWVTLAALMSASFEGAVVYTPSAVALAGVAIALTAYASYLSAVNLTAMLLSVILALFAAVGTLTSMLSATDPLWWEKNLSTLGMGGGFSARAFNITLIIAGLILTAIARYATSLLPDDTRSRSRGRTLTRIGLALIGVLLACVGFFPLDENVDLHNMSASGMAIVYVALVLSLGWLVDSMPRLFVVLGYVYVGVIAVLAACFITGYYNLTAVELVAAALIFSWVILFLRNVGAVHANVVAARARTRVADHDVVA